MIPGEEKYIKTAFDLFGEKPIYQYEYMHLNGSYFSVSGNTLEDCRAQRDRWLTRFSVAFTGHRIARMLAVMKNHPRELDNIGLKIQARLHSLCVAGYHTFYSGMAEGFDLMAAEQVNILKSHFAGVRLIAVIPFCGQEHFFSQSSKKQYEVVLLSADEVVTLSTHYYPGCFGRRNDYLLRHSGRVLAFFDGRQYGGTAYTIRQAHKKGLIVENLFEG